MSRVRHLLKWMSLGVRRLTQQALALLRPFLKEEQM
ncbi:protein of unknown function [Citrobacter freundii]|nr:protein of unknown function [Citrobacter freundii]